MEITKKIIITGGAGFIGFNLASQLARENYHVIIWDNLSRGKYDIYLKRLLKKKNIQFIKKDLTKKINANKLNVSHIFHLAGTVGVSNINKNPYKSFLNNFLTLKNIIDFNKNLKKEAKLILFSTSEIYSNLIKKKLVKFPLKETNDIIIENKIIGRDSYFLSKIFNEKFLQLSNLNYLILRPHNIYGPRMGYSHIIPELTKRMLNNKNVKKIEIYSPYHKRAFCYIDDAVHQIIKLSMKKNIKNQIFNIGNMKEEIRMIDVAKKIKSFLNIKTKLKKGKVTKGSPTRRVPDMSKTLKKIQIKKFVSFDEGLKLTLNWYRNQLN